MRAYDWSKVSRETLEKLARLSSLYMMGQQATSLHLALDDARAEALVPPLRTRAERDRELVDLLGGSAHAPQHGREITFNIERENLHRILDLIVESTTPEPERCVAADLAFDCLDPKCKAHERVLTEPEPLAPDPNHTDVIRPPDAPEPDPCSCEEALGLRERLLDARALLERWLTMFDRAGLGISADTRAWFAGKP